MLRPQDALPDLKCPQKKCTRLRVLTVWRGILPPGDPCLTKKSKHSRPFEIASLPRLQSSQQIAQHLPRLVFVSLLDQQFRTIGLSAQICPRALKHQCQHTNDPSEQIPKRNAGVKTYHSKHCTSSAGSKSRRFLNDTLPKLQRTGSWHFQCLPNMQLARVGEPICCHEVIVGNLQFAGDHVEILPWREGIAGGPFYRSV